MSIESLKNAFSRINSCSNWSLQLLKITTSKTKGTRYDSRQIQLEPATEMVSLINEISRKYLSNGKGSLDFYTDVTDYDGTASGTTVYRLQKDNPLIATEYSSLLTAIANPNVEADPFAYKSAYLLKGALTQGDDTVPIKLVSMQSPITSLKQKFRLLHPSGRFSQISHCNRKIQRFGNSRIIACFADYPDAFV